VPKAPGSGIWISQYLRKLLRSTTDLAVEPGGRMFDIGLISKYNEFHAGGAFFSFTFHLGVESR